MPGSQAARKPAPRFLLLGGQAIEYGGGFGGFGGHGGNIVQTLELELDGFVRAAFGLPSYKDLATQLVSADGSPCRIFAQPEAAGAINHTYQTAAPILVQEARIAGYETTIVDIRRLFYLDGDWKPRVAPAWAAALRAADVVGLSTTFVTDPSLLQHMCRAIKAEGKTLVLGGPFFAARMQPNELNAFEFDYVMEYESEGRLSRLFAHLAAGERSTAGLHAIPGLIWRENGRVTRASTPYTAIDINEVFAPPTADWLRDAGGVFAYEGSRGCPFRCKFCDFPFLLGNKKARFKSAEKIYEEWKALAELGATKIMVVDSQFTVPKRRMEELTQKMKETGLAERLAWGCFARSPELADPRFVERLRQAGCKFVSIGIESGSQVILDAMVKDATVEDNRAALNNLRGFEVAAANSYLVGFPGETADTIEETLAFMADHVSEVCTVHPWQAFPTVQTKVPILQPAARSEHGIEVSWDRELVHLSVWGKQLAYVPPSKWRHNTMSQPEAYHHLGRIVTLLGRPEIECCEENYSPYRRLLASKWTIPHELDYPTRRKFYLGLKQLFIDYMAGRCDQMRDRTDGWLASCGVTWRSGSRPPDAS